MREILLKILEEVDADIRESFLKPVPTYHGAFGSTISATTTPHRIAEAWEYMENPMVIAIKWQQMRNHNKLVKAKLNSRYENRHGKGGAKPEGGGV